MEEYLKYILPIVKPSSGCDAHRIIFPLTAMGYDIAAIPRVTSEEVLKDVRVLFFNRTPENPFDKVMQYKWCWLSSSKRYY